MKTFKPESVAMHADGKGMDMYFSHPDESCEYGYRVTAPGVVYDTPCYLEALVKYWEVCRMRTDAPAAARIYESRTAINRYILTAVYDDRKREEFNMREGDRSLKDVFHFLRRNGASLSTKAGFHNFVKTKLTEGVDYTNKYVIWFTDSGIKKAIYQYLGMDFIIQ